MGPDSENGRFAIYFNGQPVEISGAIPEITVDYSKGGISAEEADEAMVTIPRVWTGETLTATIIGEGFREIFNAAELGTALNMAKVLEPTMFYRYYHTKKKRVRKKYEKRIRAWFGEVCRICSD